MNTEKNIEFWRNIIRHLIDRNFKTLLNNEKKELILSELISFYQDVMDKKDTDNEPSTRFFKNIFYLFPYTLINSYALDYKHKLYVNDNVKDLLRNPSSIEFMDIDFTKEIATLNSFINNLYLKWKDCNDLEDVDEYNKCRVFICGEELKQYTQTVYNDFDENVKIKSVRGEDYETKLSSINAKPEYVIYNILINDENSELENERGEEFQFIRRFLQNNKLNEEEIKTFLL